MDFMDFIHFLLLSCRELMMIHELQIQVQILSHFIHSIVINYLGYFNRNEQSILQLLINVINLFMLNFHHVNS